MKPDIENIFDSNACLTRHQVQDYISATMPTEEIEAVERHFSTCPLCREAMDGYLAHSDRALETLGSLDTQFLRGQIGNIQQQHPAKPVPVLTKPSRRRKSIGRPPNFHSLIQLFIFGGLFLLFRNELSKPEARKALSHLMDPAPVQTEPVVVTHGLKEAKAEPAPAPVQPKRFPDAPVGRNLKMPNANEVALRTDADTGHIVTAPRLAAQPAAARPVGTASLSTGVASVTTGSATATPKAAGSIANSGTPKPKAVATPGITSEPNSSNAETANGAVAPAAAASAPQPNTAKHVVTIGPHDDFFEEPNTAKSPAKPGGATTKPSGSHSESTSQPAKGKPEAPEKPVDDWLWQ